VDTGKVLVGGHTDQSRTRRESENMGVPHREMEKWKWTGKEICFISNYGASNKKNIALGNQRHAGSRKTSVSVKRSTERRQSIIEIL